MQFFKHDTNMISDNKIQRLVMTCGGIAYAVYNVAIEKIGCAINENNQDCGLPAAAKIIAHELWENEDKVKDILKCAITLGLFEGDENATIFCPKILARINVSDVSNVQLRNAISNAKKELKKKNDETSQNNQENIAKTSQNNQENITKTSQNNQENITTEIDIEKESDIEIETEKEIHTQPETNNELPQYFLKLWQTSKTKDGMSVFQPLARIAKPNDWREYWSVSPPTKEQIDKAVNNFIDGINSGAIERRFIPSTPDKFVLNGGIQRYQQPVKPQGNKDGGLPTNRIRL